MRHLIVRQIFDLHLGSTREAFGTQQRLSRFFQEEAAPALERLFDRIAPPDKVLRIERLEVDLGFLQEDQIDTEATLHKLVSAVEEAIQRALRDAGTAPAGDAFHSVFLQWLYFLECGVLPWYAENRLPAGWPAKVLEQLGLEAAAATRLRKLLLGASPALDRLVLQHSDDFLEAVATLLTGRSHAPVQKLIHELSILSSSGAAIRKKSPVPMPAVAQTRHQLWKWVFANDLHVQGGPPMETLLSAFLRYRFTPEILLAWLPVLKGRKSKDFPVLRRIWPGLNIVAGAKKQVQDFSKSPDNQNAKKAEDGNQAADAAPGQPAPQPIAIADTGKTGNVFSSEAAPQNEGKGPVPDPALLFQPRPEQSPVLPDKEEAWFVANAGIVLANGYLSRFFNNLDLLKPDRQFRDAEAQNKAALLIHFLATGETEAPEYLLLLPKVLCGIPAGRPLELFTPLAPFETEEAEALLQAMIGHWEALGNTSPEGLREGFLQRNGRLHLADNGWRLQVERQTIDILIDRSPFGFNVIKLPWMKDPLRVEW